jgi:hypothetical protein
MPIDVAIGQDVQSLVRQIDEDSLTWWLRGMEWPDVRESLDQCQPYVIQARVSCSDKTAWSPCHSCVAN